MYAIVYQGFRFEFQTFQEWAQAYEYLKVQGAETQNLKVVEPKQTTSSERYLAILERLNEVGSNGIKSRDLARHLGYRSGRTLSGIALSLRKFIRSRGVNVERVFSIESGNWRPGPNIQVALEALRENKSE